MRLALLERTIDNLGVTLLRRAAIVVPALALFLCAPGSARIGSMRSCQFVSAPRAVAAFCDKFNHPIGTGNRSGELDGLVWGVSRATSNNNPPQGMLYSWAAVGRDTCGRLVLVRPEQDVAICDGQAVEAVNDNGGVTDLAMYPRQPFDFAGRTDLGSGRRRDRQRRLDPAGSRWHAVAWLLSLGARGRQRPRPLPRARRPSSTPA